MSVWWCKWIAGIHLDQKLWWSQYGQIVRYNAVTSNTVCQGLLVDTWRIPYLSWRRNKLITYRNSFWSWGWFNNRQLNRQQAITTLSGYQLTMISAWHIPKLITIGNIICFASGYFDRCIYGTTLTDPHQKHLSLCIRSLHECNILRRVQVKVGNKVTGNINIIFMQHKAIPVGIAITTELVDPDEFTFRCELEKKYICLTGWIHINMTFGGVGSQCFRWSEYINIL